MPHSEERAVAETRLERIDTAAGSLEIAFRHRPGGDDWCVFLHGLGCNGDSFEGAFTAGVLDGYSLLSLDLPGHGDSQCPAELDYTMEQHAEAVVALLRHLCRVRSSAPRFHLVGHSMGGAVALLAGERLGEECRSHVSVEGNLIDDDCRFGSRRVAAVPSAEFLVEGMDRVRESIDPAESPGSSLYRDWLLRASPIAFHRSATSLVEWSDSGRLLAGFCGLKINKAYIYGERNSDAAVLAQLGGIRRIAIGESGHFPMCDNPPDFYAAVSGCLERAVGG